MTRKRVNLLPGALLLAATTFANTALAREPGVPPSVPPGNSLGVPIGASPPPGIYLNTFSSVNSLELKDDDGNDLGADIDITDTAVQLLWVPGFKLLGADYKAFILQPFLHIDQSSTFPPVANGSEFGLGNTEIHPIDLSWSLAPGHFVSAGLSIFAPTGKWDAEDPINTAGDFWTLAPSLGYSYLKNGWNASAHLQYFTNTENKDNDYRSGDEVLLNGTALKDLGGYSLGPVGTYRKQLSKDRNDGPMYGGMTGGEVEQLGLGIGFASRVGKTGINVNLTHDVAASNTPAGNSLKLNFSIPLGGGE